MTPEQLKKYYALSKELDLAYTFRYDLAKAYSRQRTKHLSELTAVETQALFAKLQEQVNEAKAPYRGKIIYLLCQVGMVGADGKANFDRINAYIQNMGTANPRKVILSWCYKSELIAILKQVEMYHKSFKSQLEAE